MENIRRLAVFCFYDFEGIVDEYNLYLIKSMDEVVDDIVIIVNGFISKEGLEKLSSYTKNVYLRENYGYDSGSYKHFFTQYMTRDEISSYDEIVLLNNGFYGPLFPLQDMFDFMENVKADYWGITKTKKIKSLWGEYMPHIQSYFIVFKRNILHDNGFYQFWKNLNISNDFNEAVREFEIGINIFLNKSGYVGSAYTDFFGAQNYFKDYENPYYMAIYNLVKKCKCPFIKRKPINTEHWIDVKKTLNYVQENTNYNLELLWENWNRYDKNKKIESYCIHDITNFADSHRNIYVYGHGNVGKRKMEIIKRLGYDYAMYLVSDSSTDNNVLSIDDVDFTSEDGIIIGVGIKFYDEVYNRSVELVGKENVLEF